MARELSTAAKAARDIRRKFKVKGIVARVRSSNFAGGDSIRVDLTDAPPSVFAEAAQIAHLHQYGTFDGMTDSYSYDRSHPNLNQVRFVHVNNNMSDAMVARIVAFCEERYNDYGDRAEYERMALRHHTFEGQPHVLDFWKEDAA